MSGKEIALLKQGEGVSLNHLVLKGLLGLPGSTPCSRWIQTTLLRAVFSQVLNVFKGKDSTASLDNLCQ